MTFWSNPNEAMLFVVVATITLIQRSAGEFFLDPGSIPAGLSGTPGAWDSFHNFRGCHSGQRVEGLSRLKSYFHYFGYIPAPPPPSANFSDEFDQSFEAAVLLYQKNFQLDVTGELDNNTLAHMALPRCGVADIINGTNSMANETTVSKIPVAHYTFFQGQPRWPSYKKTLTYGFLPSNELSETVKGVFGRAFSRWSAVIPLNFSETENYYEADIRIGFYSGDHGDGEAFDGVLGTLGHSFSPTDGRLHLDMAETWVINDVQDSPVSTAVDLESVAVHEIGHILGLGHSAVQDAIMYPTIKSRTQKLALANDDVQGVQLLYGTNPNYVNAADAHSADVSALIISCRRNFWPFAPLLLFSFFLY